MRKPNDAREKNLFQEPSSRKTTLESVQTSRLRIITCFAISSSAKIKGFHIFGAKNVFLCCAQCSKSSCSFPSLPRSQAPTLPPSEHNKEQKTRSLATLRFARPIHSLMEKVWTCANTSGILRASGMGSHIEKETTTTKHLKSPSQDEFSSCNSSRTSAKSGFLSL